MRILIFLLLNTFFLVGKIDAQNLMNERIRKVTSHKKSVFIDKGIFHYSGLKTRSSLKTIRHHFSKKNFYERVVFDFSTKKIPRIYGYISKMERKLYIDFFQTSLLSTFNTYGDSKYIESINFYPIGNEMLSAEIIFKKEVVLDIFYLSDPGRFVIDVKSD